MVHRAHHRQRRHDHGQRERQAGGAMDAAAGLERRARRPWPQNHRPRYDRAPGPRPEQHGVLQEHPPQAAGLTALRPLLLLTGCRWALAAAGWPADLKPTFPSAEWERVKPETIGYSIPKLEALRAWLKTQKMGSTSRCYPP